MPMVIFDEFFHGVVGFGFSDSGIAKQKTLLVWKRHNQTHSLTHNALQHVARSCFHSLDTKTNLFDQAKTDIISEIKVMHSSIPIPYIFPSESMRSYNQLRQSHMVWNSYVHAKPSRLSQPTHTPHSLAMYIPPRPNYHLLVNES